MHKWVLQHSDYRTFTVYLVCASVLIHIDILPLPHDNLIMKKPQEEDMEVQEVFVVITLSVFNICWGVMASLPVRTLCFKENKTSKTDVAPWCLKWNLRVGWGIEHFTVLKTTLQAPLFPIEASEKGATGSQISPGGPGWRIDPVSGTQCWAPCIPASSSPPFLSQSWSTGEVQFLSKLLSGLVSTPCSSLDSFSRACQPSSLARSPSSLSLASSSCLPT